VAWQVAERYFRRDRKAKELQEPAQLDLKADRGRVEGCRGRKPGGLAQGLTGGGFPTTRGGCQWTAMQALKLLRLFGSTKVACARVVVREALRTRLALGA
jgi:hypothetical protein